MLLYAVNNQGCVFHEHTHRHTHRHTHTHAHTHKQTYADRQTDGQTNLDPWHIQQMNRRITDTNVIAMTMAAATMIINNILSSELALSVVVSGSSSVGGSVSVDHINDNNTV